MSRNFRKSVAIDLIVDFQDIVDFQFIFFKIRVLSLRNNRFIENFQKYFSFE